MMFSIRSFTLIIAALALVACNNKQDDEQKGKAVQESAATASADTSREVLETLDSGGYTYLKVTDKSGFIWVASRPMKVAVGERVVIGQGMVMNDFRSDSLDRTFKQIVFAEQVTKFDPSAAATAPVATAGGELAPPAGLTSLGSPHQGKGGSVSPMAGKPPAIPAPEPPKGMDLSGITKAEGGFTVAELFQQREVLAGKEVTVRGRVVKANPEVMGTNWMHVQDGTGTAPGNDLTVTSSTLGKVGDLVYVKGTLAVDKTIGHGSKYPLFIGEATLTIESSD
jgi:hypothetical protein